MNPRALEGDGAAHVDLLTGRLVSIAGIPVVVRVQDAPHAAVVGEVLSCLRPHRGPAQLEIMVGSDPPRTPTRPVDRQWGEIAVWREGETLVLLHAEGVAVRVSHDGAQFGGSGARPVRAFRQLFPLVIAHLLGRRGLFVLHGGGVQREGRATLVLGASAGGKSTLVLAATRNGWSGLSDDLVAVRAAPAGPEVAGIPKSVAIPRGAARGPGMAPIPGDGRGRWTVPIEWDPSWYRIGATVISTYAEGKTEVHRLGTEALLEWLLFSFLSTEPTLLAPYLGVAAGIASASGWDIRHAAGPRGARRDAVRALAAVGASPPAPPPAGA